MRLFSVPLQQLQKNLLHHVFRCAKIQTATTPVRCQRRAVLLVEPLH